MAKLWWCQFTVLMWRYKQLYRSPGKVFMICVMPILVWLFLYFLRIEIGNPIVIDEFKSETFHPVKGLEYSELRYNKILYSPANENIRIEYIVSLMRTVLNDQIEFVPWNGDDLKTYFYSSTSRTLGVIIFPTIPDNGTFPKECDIQIRFPDRLRIVSKLAPEMNTHWKQEDSLTVTRFSNYDSKDNNYVKYPEYYLEGYLAVMYAFWKAFIRFTEVGDEANFQHVPNFDKNLHEIQMVGFTKPAFEYDTFFYTINESFPLLVVLSFFMGSLVYVNTMMSAKSRKKDVYHKVIGLKTWVSILTNYLFGIVSNMVMSIALLVVLKVQMYQNVPAILPSSQITWLLYFMFVYSSCIVTFCLLVTEVSSDENLPVAFAGGYFILSTIPFVGCTRRVYNNTTINYLLCFLLPNLNMGVGFHIILFYEKYEHGLRISNLFQPSSNIDHITFFDVLVMGHLHAVLVMLLVFYLSGTTKKKFGIRKKWYYIFKRKSDTLCDVPDLPPKDGIEGPPPDVEPIIKLRDLSVVRNQVKAINKLNFDLYKGEITVITGQNGSGKTSTIMLMAGMLQATQGAIYIDNHRFNVPVGTQSTKKFGNIGFCPQKSIIYEKMKVWEHIYYVCRLKGYTKFQSHVDVRKFLNVLDLENVKDDYATNISIGEKQRLAIAMAFCGGTDIIFLDEPSSHLEPYARKALWKLFKSENAMGHTIILTTSNVEEVETVANRAIILRHGKLLACGSVPYLNKFYDVGHLLNLTKQKTDIMDDPITTFLQEFIPQIKLVRSIGRYTHYLIPNDGGDFKTLMENLEINKERFGIRSFLIQNVSFQDIFQRSVYKTDSSNVSSSGVNMKLHKRHLGNYQVFSQFYAMFLKQIYLAKNNKMVYLFKILAPSVIVLLTLFCYLCQFIPSPPTTLDINYVHKAEVLIARTSSLTPESTDFSDILDYVESIGGKVHNIEDGLLMDEAYSKRVLSNKIDALKVLVGIEFGKIIDTLYFNVNYFDASAVALTTYYQSKIWQNGKGYKVWIQNDPIPEPVYQKYTQQTSLNFFDDVSLALSIGYTFFSGIMGMACAKEREENLKYLQLMNGIPLLIFWLAELIWAYILYFAVTLLIILSILISQLIYLQDAAAMDVILSTLLIYGFIFILMVYVLSTSTSNSISMMFDLGTGLLMTVVVMVLQTAYNKSIDIILPYRIHDILYLAFPLYGICYVINLRYIIAFNKLYCKKNIEHCLRNDRDMSPISQFYCEEIYCRMDDFCCRGDTKDDKSVIKEVEATRILTCIIFTSIIYVFILVCHETNFSQRFFVNDSKHADPLDEDADVAAEKRRIRQYRLFDLKSPVLIIRDLRRSMKHSVAVNGICLELKWNECFCLLGPSTSEVPTVMKILTSMEPRTGGVVYYNGYSIDDSLATRSLLFGGNIQNEETLYKLTVMQFMKLITLIRGYNKKEIKSIIYSIALEFDYINELNMWMDQLSEGYVKRILNSLCILGNCPIILLHTPSNGLDTVSKQRLWQIMLKLKAEGKCIVFTSHDDGECDIMGDRFAIMAGGNFKCLGTFEQVKQRYMLGFWLQVHLLPCSNLKIFHVELFVVGRFKNTRYIDIMESEMTFHIDDKHLSLDQCHRIMEYGKENLPIEGYTISEVALNNVFELFIRESKKQIRHDL